MRLLRCFVSVLLVFVLLFALCSISCFAAAEVDGKPPEDDYSSIPMTMAQTSSGSSSNYSARYRCYYNLPSGGFDTMLFTRAYSQPPPASSIDILDSYSIIPYTNYDTTENFNKWFNYTMVDEFIMIKNDGSLLAKKNQGVKFLMSNLNGAFYGYNKSGDLIRESNFDVSKIQEIRLYLMYTDGSISYYSDFDYDIFNVTTDANGVITPTTKLSGKYSVNLTINNLPSDIVGLNVEVCFIPKEVYNNTVGNHNGPFANCYTTQRWVGYTYTSEFSVYLIEATDGLLSGILGIVKNIKDGVTNTVSAITELPGKLWSVMENGIKGLFIPTEQQLTEVKADWDNLLSDRFGGLYQSVQLIDDYAKTFTNTDSKNTIKVPELSVDLADSTFTFGGQDVQIIPDKFSFLIDVIKTIISIIATTFFVNGLRNRFTREVIEGGNEQ